MITKYSIKCKIEEIAGNVLVFIMFGIPTLVLLYAMYLQSGGQPFAKDLWLYITKIF